MEKTYFPIFIVLICFLLFITGCKRSEIENEPFISFSAKSIINTTTGEPIAIHLLGKEEITDTLFVGDTIIFKAYISGVYNHLKELSISSSNKNAVELLWSDKSRLDSLFLNTSNYEEGIFHMDGTHKGLNFVFRYIPLEEDINLTLFFKVLSDAKHYPDGYRTIITPVKIKQ